jgi:WD40 repeat protein
MFITADDTIGAKIWDINGNNLLELSCLNKEISYSDAVCFGVGDTKDMWWYTSAHHYGLHSAAFSVDGKKVVTTSWDKMMKVWDIENQKLLLTAAFPIHFLYADFHPNGQSILCRVPHHGVYRYDIDCKSDCTTLFGHQSVAYDPRNHNILTTDDRRYIDVYNEHGEVIISFKIDIELESAHFSPNGEFIVVRGTDCKLYFFHNPENRNDLKKFAMYPSRFLYAVLDHHQEPIHSVRFFHDGSKVVVSTRQGSIKVWDIVTKKVSLVLQGTQHKYFWGYNIDISSDDKYLLTADNHKAKLWDLRTGKNFFITGDDRNNAIDIARFSPAKNEFITTAVNYYAPRRQEMCPITIWQISE